MPRVRYASAIPLPAGTARTRTVPTRLSTMSSLFRVLAAFVVGCLMATPSHTQRALAFCPTRSPCRRQPTTARRLPGILIPASTFRVGAALDLLLANFDVLLLFEDSVFSNATAVGNRVAEFANSGHAVVLGTFYDQDRSDALSRHARTARMGRARNHRSEHDRRRRHVVCACARWRPPYHPPPSADARRHDARRRARQSGCLRRRQPGQTRHRRRRGVDATNARGETDPAIAYRITGAACVIHIGIAPQYGVVRTSARTAPTSAATSTASGATRSPSPRTLRRPASSRAICPDRERLGQPRGARRLARRLLVRDRSRRRFPAERIRSRAPAGHQPDGRIVAL